MSSSCLNVKKVGVAFAGLRALHEVDLAIQTGQIVGLMGPNGAGKTTMVNVLTGFQTPSSGQVLLDTQVLNGKKAHQFRRLGIARTFQAGRLFKTLSVEDNLCASGVALGLSQTAAQNEARAVLELMGLSNLAQQMAGNLPYSHERRVGIARAVMMQPQFLLLDEPAAGMSEHDAKALSHAIQALVARIGCGVLLIEHNVRMVLDTCAHIVVLDSGEVIETGDAEKIRHSEAVRHAYMGTSRDMNGTLVA